MNWWDMLIVLWYSRVDQVFQGIQVILEFPEKKESKHYTYPDKLFASYKLT